MKHDEKPKDELFQDIVCAERRKVLDCSGHLLVLGGPGSGKTTIALQKAFKSVETELRPGQSVLFLSFSRAAVARLAQASKGTVPAKVRSHLEMATFHSFCWEILKSHAYLIGSPKNLKILLPFEERVRSRGIKSPAKGAKPSADWLGWQKERERLFWEEGQIAFDLFASSTAQLLRSCPLLLAQIADRFPLIIVDEAQDTGEAAWECISLLSKLSQIICLGDLEQQIFDHLEGIGPERIEIIRNALNPTEVDLGSQNNRSPGTDIVDFANDILAATRKIGKYKGVGRFVYDPKGDPSNTMRIALARTYREVKRHTGKWPESIAILGPSGASVVRVSAALNSSEKPLLHRVAFDEPKSMLAAQFAAFLLEPEIAKNLNSSIAECLEILIKFEHAKGGKTALSEAEKLKKWADSVRLGKLPKTKLISALSGLLEVIGKCNLSGDPREDWILIKNCIRSTEHVNISSLAKDLQYIVAFNRGKRISANLQECWHKHGNYTGARYALELALMEEQIQSVAEDLTGVHVMTIHKSKGKQFDAVVVFREGQQIDRREWKSSLIWREDNAPYPRSRKILRVAITRARKFVLLLEPRYPGCPILSPFKL